MFVFTDAIVKSVGKVFVVELISIIFIIFRVTIVVSIIIFYYPYLQ